MLAHMERWEPHIRATYLLRPEHALAQARQRSPLAARRAPGAARRGAHHHQGKHRHPGQPHTAGHRRRAAGARCRRCAPRRPPARSGRGDGGQNHHARLRHAVLRAVELHPLSRNPWDVSKGPGGSSAGGGAAAAAGYGPLHIGTDIGGSLRLPASWCGIFSLKPSLGRIPIDPPYTGRAAGP